MTKSQIKYSRGESFFFVMIAYLMAITIPCLMLPYLQTFHPIIRIGILDFFATIIIFVFSYRLDNSSMYDPYWSVIPIPIVIYFVIENNDGNLIRQIIILSLVSFWGIRLTFNWVRGWPGLHHQDWRYDDLQKNSGKAYWVVSFTGIHLLPTILVFLGLIPLYYATSISEPMTYIDFLASLIALGAIIIELISDEQLRKFRRSPDFQPGQIIQSGLWAYSRHPNYFGELTFWLGLFLFSLNLKMPDFLWLGSGIIGMVLLFVFASIPMMEKRSMEKRPEYTTYKKRISMIIPFPSRKS